MTIYLGFILPTFAVISFFVLVLGFFCVPVLKQGVKMLIWVGQEKVVVVGSSYAYS